MTAHFIPQRPVTIGPHRDDGYVHIVETVTESVRPPRPQKIAGGPLKYLKTADDGVYTPMCFQNTDRSTGAPHRSTSHGESKQPAADVDASPGKRAPEKVEDGMPGLHGAQPSSRSGHIPGAAGSPAPRTSLQKLGLGVPEVERCVPRHPPQQEP